MHETNFEPETTDQPKANEARSPRPTKRLTRRRFFLGATAIAGALYTDMRFVEPNWLGTGQFKVPVLPPGSSPIRILHMSDLHVSYETPLSFIEHAIELSRTHQPDLVCLTGDFITVRWEDWRGYSDVLRTLTSLAPCYATTGNHDGGEWMAAHGGYAKPTKVVAMLEAADIQVLMNEERSIALPNKPAIQLMGFGDWWARDFHPYELLTERTTQTPRIVMSHNPDTKDLIGDLEWDLMLSGHTHGGQLTLPWGSTPFAPVKDHRYVRGLHRWQNHWLYVTKGIGSLKHMRLNCFPEISIVDLIAKPT